MTQFTEQATSRFATVSEGPLTNFKIHYNDAGDGEVVVVMHGSGPGASGWSNFSRNVAPFVDAGFRVLLVDSPGWSKSDPIVVTEGTRTVHNAAAVKGVLDSLNISRASLIGNSMGGSSALQFTLLYPDRVDKLIVMGARSGAPSFFMPLPAEGIKRLTELYITPSKENLMAMLKVFVYDTAALTDDLIKSRFDNMMLGKHHLDNFVKSLRANPKHLNADFSARLPEVKAKTLITFGRDDRFIPLDAGLQLLCGLPDAQMHIFSRCGHWAQWEHADAFNRLVIDFIKNS